MGAGEGRLRHKGGADEGCFRGVGEGHSLSGGSKGCVWRGTSVLGLQHQALCFKAPLLTRRQPAQLDQHTETLQHTACYHQGCLLCASASV